MPEPIQPTTPPPETPKAPPSISLSVDEYQRFRGLEVQLAELSKAQQAALDAKEQDRLKAVAEKDGSTRRPSRNSERAGR